MSFFKALKIISLNSFDGKKHLNSKNFKPSSWSLNLKLNWKIQSYVCKEFQDAYYEPVLIIKQSL